MNLPQLPTDNLYKFVAIAGLTLFVVSVALPMREVWEVERQIARMETQYEIGQLETDLRLPGYLRYRDLSFTLAAGQDTLSDSVRAALEQEADSIRSQWPVDTTRQVMLDLAESLNKMRINTAETAILSRQNSRLISFALFGGGCGLALTILGFGLWYRRVQKFQDAALKRRAETE